MLPNVLLVSLFSVLLSCATGEASSAYITDTGPFEPSGCEQNKTCKVAVKCSPDKKVKKANVTSCITATGLDGICCPTEPRQKRSVWQHGDDYFYWAAIYDGRRQYDEVLRHMHEHRETATAQPKPDCLHHQFLQPMGYGQEHSGDPTSQADVNASRKFADMTQLSLEDRQGGLSLGEDRTVEPTTMWCDPNARYRTIDGTCNNPLPDRAGWGSVGYPFERLLPPAYEDGVWAPKTHSVTGHPLLSTRTISSILLPDGDNSDPHLNILFMQLGQFITHDISRSQSFKLDSGGDVECCTNDSSLELYGEEGHVSCKSIEFSQFGGRCMNFGRIQQAYGSKCTLGYTTQGNSVTHFIDASPVYGSSDHVAASVRTFHQGQLRSSFPSGIAMLPYSTNPKDCVPWARVCFEVGDIRVNQLLALTQVQTMFLKEHDRLAKGLSHINPHWDDEKLYQEARRIVIAEYQNLVFNEYLPLLLGREKVQKLGLVDPPEGYTNFYNSDLPPMVIVESAVATFCFGYSIVDGFFRLLSHDAPRAIVPIAEVFLDPSKVLEPNCFDRMMHSFGGQAQQQKVVTYEPFNLDLAATSMQRYRDIATCSYNDYRELAGLPRVTDFRQLGNMGSLLESVYASADDIELWPGSLMEPFVEGSVVGPTFSYLITKMFARLKFGDRYYFTNGPEVNPGAFTPQQLSEIRRTSLASIICSNVDNWYDFYQTPRALLRSSGDNEPVPCSSYYTLYLQAWRE